MMVWFVLALMTAAAVLCVVWPLVRAPRGKAVGPAFDVGFYKHQLAEIEADVARGMLPAEDAGSARTELGRRLLVAAERDEGEIVRPSRRTGLAAAVMAALLVPAGALGLYLRIGSPSYDDVPLASRASPERDVAALVERVESHLASHPDDARGYELIAPVYMQMGRFNDAAQAYGALLRLKGDTPDRNAAYGQALVLAADGVVTHEARAAFDAALKGDPNLPQARFFVGVAAEQDGDKARARAIWQKLADEAPAGAPWLETVRRRLAGLDAAPPASPVAVASAEATGGPSGPGAAAIAALPPDQRLAAIRGMVEGLAARLAQNGHDPDGWLRLIRAYTVLGESDKAHQAVVDARKASNGDEATLGRIDDLARRLGLEG